MEEIAVYTLFDDNYFDYGATLIYSFFKYNDWFDGDFVVINDDKYCTLSDENKERLRKFSKNIKFLTVKNSEYIRVLDNQYEICSVNKKWLSCFFELELFRTKYDKALWLDSDTIVMASIRELFEDKKLDGKFSCCGDCQDLAADYFNAGVYRVDKEFLKKYPFKKVYDFCAKVTKDGLITSRRALCEGMLVIQDCLNHLIVQEDRFFLPHSFYNMSVFFNTHTPLCKIHHYNGGLNKPNGPTEKSGRYNWFFEPWHRLHGEAMNNLRELEENGK